MHGTFWLKWLFCLANPVCSAFFGAVCFRNFVTDSSHFKITLLNIFICIYKYIRTKGQAVAKTFFLLDHRDIFFYRSLFCIHFVIFQANNWYHFNWNDFLWLDEPSASMQIKDASIRISSIFKRIIIWEAFEICTTTDSQEFDIGQMKIFYWK